MFPDEIRTNGCRLRVLPPA